MCKFKLTLNSRLWICVAFLASTCVRGQIAGTGIGHPSRGPRPGHGVNSRDAPGVCATIEIRNHANFKLLENCTVIEGHLGILLMEKPHDGRYDQLSFPELREVTHYVMLYRVYGLKSLSEMFPNLAVIRGQDLFYDYALVIYETIDMEDIGLRGLTTIERGAVRLEKNPKLCYIHTIDWKKIAPSMEMNDHYFKDNKPSTECVNVRPNGCPVTVVDGESAARSWNIHHCQKIIDCPLSINCPSLMCSDGICCNSKCLGGCNGTRPSDCVACRNVIDYTQGYGICSNKCSPGTYRFHNRRCLTEIQCMAMGRDTVLIPSRNGMDSECAASCPAGMSNTSGPTCELCVERCPKACPQKRVDSVGAAQELKGCTKIKGALEIRINSGSNIGQELEENLGQIEEVTSYVWIHSSGALLSLDFFKSLRKIHGETLYRGKYALMVDDNVNMENLFSEKVKNNLEIVNGGISFHFNRKLCYNKIMDLVDTVKMNASIQNDISEASNGDEMPCDYAKLNLHIYRVSSRAAFLTWENFKTSDERNLLGYVIHYKEAKYKNVSKYDGRHACGEYLWKSKDLLNTKKEAGTHLIEMLLRLSPWTQYAIYIETYTTALAKKGGISEIMYFRTAATTPTIPQNLVVKAKKSNQLHLTWDPPERPNGNVTHYEVYWRQVDMDPKQYLLRDYCTFPVQKDGARNLEQQEKDRIEKERQRNKDGNCCECPHTNLKKKEKEQTERLMQIRFQNYLQTSIYIKRDSNRNSNIRKYQQMQKNSSAAARNETRGRRSLDPFLVDDIHGNVTEYNTTDLEAEVNNTDDSDIPTNPYLRAVVLKREFVIPNLFHYKDYNIEVIACQDRDPREKHPKDQAKLCSGRALALARTMTSKVGDNINGTSININVLKNKTGEVILKWSPPINPNGIIITYEIKFKNTDISNVQPVTVCVTQKEFKGSSGHKITKLDSGNYTFSIRAISLAGNGSWTDPRFFVIDSLPDGSMPQELIVVVCVVVGIVVVVITGIVVWCMARRRFHKYPDIQNISANPEYMSNYDAYIADDWEVDRDEVKLLNELGQGSFGMVYKGIAHGLKEVDGEFSVAVKTVNSSATFTERMSFLNEASIMKGFVCSHVVRLLGVVSEGVAQGKPAYVIMELMEHGDLKNFLRKHRPDEEDNDGRQPPTLHRIMQMAGEIADGMAYLADKKFVHRDLAARNCMVAENLTVKIGDFGMTRDIYETDYYRKGGKGLLPVRWMAPESLKDGIFTSMSDVWSYGVVIWEMATLAAQPYQGLSNEEVLKYVINAKTMDMPEGCPEVLFELMLRCWRYRPKQRPTFKEIIELLVPELDPEFKESSFFFNEGKPESYDYHDEFGDMDEDDSHMPFISGEGASLGAAGGAPSCLKHEDDLDFVDADYRYSSYPHNPVGASEPCDCILVQETKPPGGSGVGGSPSDNHRYIADSNSAIGSSSNDGSKESSKSSNHSYNPINGINIPPNIANGHLPVHMRTTTSC